MLPSLVCASEPRFSFEALMAVPPGSPNLNATSDEPDTDEARESAETPVPQEGWYSFSLGKGWRGDIIPDGLIYPRYLADPCRPTISASYQNYLDSEIPDTGDGRYLFRFGMRKGLARVAWGEDNLYALQFDVMAGWMGLFDLGNSQDNIGWDGLYGWFFTFTNGVGFAAQLGAKHRSSHVGDEYIENTGRSRVEYSRNEYVLGLSLEGLEYLTVYGEGGYGYDLRNPDLQEKWRVQGGLNFENGKAFFNGRSGYYAAVDLQSYQESDWNVDTTAQLGLVFPKPSFGEAWRFGLEYRRGRSFIGEFFPYDETYIALGIWIDF
jgi:hypothetical protein